MTATRDPGRYSLVAFVPSPRPARAIGPAEPDTVTIFIPKGIVMDTDNSKPDHLWKRGVSGNPKGKPRGTKSKSTQLVERLVTGNKAIIDVTVREAKAGEPLL